MHQAALQIDSQDIDKPGIWPWIVVVAALVTLSLCLARDLNRIPAQIKSSVVATIANNKIAGITAAVDGRDVTLTGTIEKNSSDTSNQARDSFVNQLRQLNGVRIVNDEITEVDPLKQAQLKRQAFKLAVEKIDASRIIFEPGSAAISLSSESTLLRAAQLLKAHPQSKLKIAGHTDNSGNAGNNLDLSRQRAQSVADFLVARGIPSTQLVVQGYGQTQPKFDNTTAEGRARNRRIEFIVMN